jgi:putative SOS response-associated peptidase YedK
MGDILEMAEISPRYNIAPTQPIPTLRYIEGQTYHLDLMRWGLVPHWSKGPDQRFAMHNARLESIEEKPSFRKPLVRQRCLIPADGWYEWQAVKKTAGKQAHFIHRPRNEIFYFAGLWDCWESPNTQPMQSCTIITTAANASLERIHSRMPIILDPEDYQRWLDPDLNDGHEVTQLLKNTQLPGLHTMAVSQYVNNARNDDPRCIEALTTGDLFDS